MVFMEKDILTANEFAKCAGIHYNTVRKMIKQGRLCAFKIGTGGKTSDLRIPKSELQKLCLINFDKIIDDIVDKRINEKKNKQRLRFFSKVEMTNSCWLWKGAKTKSGYGVYSFNCKYIRAHRASYLIHKGEIPQGMLVLHSCDVRDCVNPDHLHLGTPKNNTQEMMDRGRCNPPSGPRNACYKLSDEQVKKIRELKKTLTAKEIAKQFNISADYVYQIWAGIYR